LTPDLDELALKIAKAKGEIPRYAVSFEHRPLNWQRAGELLEDMVAAIGIHRTMIAIGQSHMRAKEKPLLWLIGDCWLAFDEERKK